MTEQLPAPLVPAEVDLRDFQGMWVDTDRLLRSDTWLEGSGDQKAAAFTLWAESWHQVPAASLPTADRLLGKLSQADHWARCKAHALRGWVHCSDGRLYHPVVAEKALEAWIEKLTSAITGATGNAKRWQIQIDTRQMREQLRAAVDALRALDPVSRTLKKKAVVIILAESPPDTGHESGADTRDESPPDAPTASPPESPRDRKGPDLTGPDLTGSLFPATAGSGSAQSANPPPAPRPVDNFDGTNGETLNGKAVVALATGFAIPADWGLDAEALGFKPAEVDREAELFRQYFVAGKGAGTRRSVRGWRQSWSNWLGKAARDKR